MRYSYFFIAFCCTLVPSFVLGSPLPVKSIGSDCVQATSGMPSSQTADEGLAITIDRTKVLSCRNGKWGIAKLLPGNGCYIGMPIPTGNTTVQMPCEPGDPVYASANSVMVIGRYGGILVAKNEHIIFASRHSSPHIYGCSGINSGANSRLDGFENTNKILASCPLTNNAAAYCKSLGPNWYLPAVDQLNELLLLAFRVGDHENFNTMGGWSSTEINSTTAYIWASSGLEVSNKDLHTFGSVVRCIRNF